MNGAVKKMDVLKIIDSHWFLMTGVLALFLFINFIVQGSMGWVPDFIPFELCFAVMTLLIPYAIERVRWACQEELVSPLSEISGCSEAETAAWIRNHAALYVAGWVPFACGVALLLVGFVSRDFFGIPWQGAARGLFFVWMSVFFFGGGVLGCQYLGMVRLVDHIGSSEVKSTVFSWPTVALRRVYFAYFYLFGIAVAFYLIGVMSVWLSPGGADLATETVIGRLWVFPPGALILLFFFYFHYKMNLLLTRCRDQSERRLSELLELKFEEWVREQTKDQERVIAVVSEWRSEIRGQNNRILNLRSVIAAVTAALLPTIKALFDYIM